jgi:LysR family transcriptional regulator, carnitine catabolism transcriptional activator
LVSAGLGITALPRLTFPLTAAMGLIWRPLRAPLLRRHIGIVTRMGRTLSPAASGFLAVLTAEADGIRRRMMPGG